jgi:hypothetical protein
MGLLAGASAPEAGPHNIGSITFNDTPRAIPLRALTSRAGSSAWMPAESQFEHLRQEYFSGGKPCPSSGSYSAASSLYL